jgi:hypothetical protein
VGAGWNVTARGWQAVNNSSRSTIRKMRMDALIVQHFSPDSTAPNLPRLQYCLSWAGFGFHADPKALQEL